MNRTLIPGRAVRARRVAPFFVLAPLLVGCASTTQHFSRQRPKVLTLRQHYSNAHVIFTDRGMILVDAGFERSAPALESRLRAEGVDPRSIRALVLTHGHADHAGGAVHFRKRFGTTILAGEGDRTLLTSGRNGALCPTDATARGRVEETRRERYTPFEADVWLRGEVDMKSLTGAGLPGKLVSIPGHTAGSVALIMGDAAFVGDLFRGSVVGSCAETHYYICNLQNNLVAIQGLLDAHPRVRRFFTGHFGPVSRDDVERYLHDRRQELAKQESG